MKELFKKLDISPKNNNLYLIAFSHSSYVNEHHLKSDYERLEFLGDSVLGMVTASYLYRHYDVVEGDLAKIKSVVVSEKILSEIALSLIHI